MCLNVEQLYLNVMLSQVLRRFWRVTNAQCTHNTGDSGCVLSLTCLVRLS